jgi:type II restriction enzyme
MPSAACEAAITSALQHGSALLKHISANDVGKTGGHQAGFYLPKSAWRMYSPQPPTKGINSKTFVKIEWQDGRITDSAVTWYGRGTRSEYRLTKFGPDFVFLSPDEVGSLLVVVPRSPDDFLAFVLDLDDDIDELQAALGVEIVDTWAVYKKGAAPPVETENECIRRKFRKFANAVSEFPSGLDFSRHTLTSLEACISDFKEGPSDIRLMRCVEQEYSLYQLVERKLCAPEITRIFRSVDDFIATANSILQRRKVRAGRSLEIHVETVLRDAGVPFDPQPKAVDGIPDILIPGAKEYNDQDWPIEKLFMVGIKRTCKDRWRQVLNEAKRIDSASRTDRRHILTIQKGISVKQLGEMQSARVRLVVPNELHRDYPRDWRGNLLTVEGFVSEVKRVLAQT